MKSIITISLNIDVIQLAKQRYKNVSAAIERLLRADLNTPESIKQTNRDKRKDEIKTEISVKIAKISELEMEMKSIAEKQAAAKRKEAEDRKDVTIV